MVKEVLLAVLSGGGMVDVSAALGMVQATMASRME